MPACWYIVHVCWHIVHACWLIVHDVGMVSAMNARDMLEMLCMLNLIQFTPHNYFTIQYYSILGVHIRSVCLAHASQQPLNQHVWISY